MSALSVSIVMGVRNGARYLRQSVESILGQSFRDFEFIIIDDGSTDETSSILEAYARSDSRVRILRNEGRGLGAALRLGIDAARAPLIARMDADDISLPQRLERQLAFLGTHPEVLAVGSAVRLIDAEGRESDIRKFPCDPQVIARDLLRYNAMAHPSVVFRREAFEQAGGYREPFRYAQDYDLWLRMSERGALANLPDVLLLFREHADQVSRQHRSASWLANALARDFADRRRRGLPEGLVAGADLVANARAALEQHLDPNALINSDRAQVVLLMAESLSELNPGSRPLARAIFARLAWLAIVQGKLGILLGVLRSYWRT